MPWSTSRRAGTDAKYRTKEHRTLREHWARKIRAGEYVECTAKVCVFRDRAITNPNGNADDGLHLGHNDDGVTYRGPEHKRCNLRDAAVRANAKSRGAAAAPRRWVL